MRLLAVLTTVAAAAVGLGSGAGGWPGADSTTAPIAFARPGARQPFLGIVNPAPNTGTSAILARLDPLSLRPVSPTLELGEYHRTWSLSPDGSQLALGISSGVSLVSPPRPLRGRIGVIVVDLETMKIVQEVETGVAAEALGWLGPRRLVAALQGGGTVLVDPHTGRIVKRWRGYSRPLAWVRTRDRLVMLFRGPYRPAANRRSPGSHAVRLAVIDARSRLRSVLLGPIQLRVQASGGYADTAGLAVDPARGRAYVSAADSPVAEVDLGTLRASYSRLGFLFLRPGELQGTPTPARRVLSRSRDAIWLGEGRLLVFGRDLLAGRGGKDVSVPAGLMLVDTASWRSRTLDSRASGAAFAAGRLLAYGTGIGLRGYTLDGHRVFHLLEGQRVFAVQVAANRAYVGTPRAVRVVEVGRGKVVGNIVPPRDLIDVIDARS